MATTAQEALRVIGSEALTLLIARPRDPANGDALVTVAIADGVWFSDPAAGAPNTSFHAVIADGSGVTLGQFLTASGQVTGPSELTQGSLTADVATDEQEAWKDLDWNGAEFKHYVGARRRADGELMVFSEFDVLLDGLIDRADPIGDAQWEIAFTDQRAELEEPVTKKFYRGFGGAFRIIGEDRAIGERVHLTSTGDVGTTVTAPVALDFIGRLITDAGVKTTLIRVRDFEIFLDASRQLGVGFHLDGTPETLTSTYVVASGEPVYAELVVAADGVTVELFAGVDGDEVASVLTGTLGSAVASGALDLVRIGSVDAGHSFDAWEARLWDEAKGIDDQQDLADGPVTDASERDEVIESWRFSEGVEIGTGPEIVFGEKSVADFTAGGSGTPTWTSSYEADDPDLFGGSPVGQEKAQSFGPVQNVRLVPLDSQRPALTWHHRDAPLPNNLYVTRLRQRGVPMVREHAVVALSVGELVFDAATNTITLTTSSYSPTGDFRLFVPGQREPARIGQRVVVANTANNDGTLRVAVDGISEDGLVLTVVGGDLVDETAPANARIDSHPADVQYTAHEAASPLPPRVELPSMPDGEVTADFAEMGSITQWSELHAAISGKTVSIPTGDDQFNPVLELHTPAGFRGTKKETLDRLARAAFGWWIEDPDNPDIHLLGTWEPPSGTPVADIPPSRLVSVEPIRAVLPVGKFEVLHSPVWHQQNGDSIAGSVSAGDRRRWAEPHTAKPVVNRRLRDVRFPDNDEQPELETLLSTDSEITRFVELAKPFHFKEARWYRLIFPDLWALPFKLNDVVTVSWDDPDLELDETLVRITGRELDLSAGTLELEVFWLKEEPT